MRATPNDILIWTTARAVLTEYARMLTCMNDKFEVSRLRDTLIAELQAIVPGAVFPPIWWQATQAAVTRPAGPNGIDAYALQRLELWPEKKDDNDSGSD